MERKINTNYKIKMKKTLLLLSLTIVLFSRCKKEEEKLNFVLNSETIAGKWNLYGYDTPYNFIEFTKDGKFFISHRYANSPNYNKNFGSYEIINEYEIEIENIGRMSIIKLTKPRIYFSIKLNGGASMNLNAIKTTKLSQSEKTKLISKSWKIESINGLKNEKGVFIFTEYGTFYQQRFSSGFKFGKWKWCNPEETKVVISTNYSPLECENNQIIENIFLTENTFKGSDNRNGHSDLLILKKE